MEVFGKKKKRGGRIALAGCLFCGVLLLFAGGMQYVSDTAGERQKEILERALNRDIVYCYASQGRYPESLDYIKEEYGLMYDESSFYVDYKVLGENIYPDVTVIEIETEKESE